MSVFSAVNLGPPVFGFVGAIANGTTQATATLVTAQVTVFTSVVSGGAAVLPAANATMSSVTVFNASSNALLVYPPVGGNIYPNATNAATTISAGLSATFSCFDPAVSGSLNWYVLSAISTGNFLPIPGGTLTGPLHMGANTIDGSAVAFTGGTINNVPIGGVTPAAGAFTTASVNSTLTINPSATNPLTVTNGNFTLTGTGNASYNFKALGTGTLNFFTQGGTNQQFQINDTASSISWLRAQGGVSGNGPTLSVANDTAGKLNLNAGTTGYVNVAAGTGLSVASGGLSYGKTSAYTAGSGVGPPGGTNVAPLWFNSNYSGTLNTGAGSLFQFALGDAIADSRSGPPAYFGWTHTLNAGYDGPRSSMVILGVKSAAAVTPSSASLTTLNLFQHVDVGDGGTSTTPYGNYTMFNPDLRVNTGDWVSAVINTEFDMRMYAGTNSPKKTIAALHYAINDGSHASPKSGDYSLAYQDGALVFDASPTLGNAGGKGLNTILFGSYTQDTPWDASASGTSLMKVWLNCTTTLTAAQRAYVDDGFKLPALYVRNSFIDNGQFVVSGTGDITSGLAKLAATSSGASLDVTGVVAVSATVASGGTGAIIGSEILDSAGGLWEVATLSGSAAATVTLKRAAAVTSAPANPVTCQMAGSNTAVTLNITWSSARSTLTLQPSGGSTAITGTVGFNGTAPVAKPNVTGSKGANAALASLLTALASYGLVTDSTT